MTRLTENDIAGIEAEWATYERRLEELTGDDLLTLAARTLGIDPETARSGVRELRVGAIPISSGEGLIGGFADSLASIAGHLGFEADVLPADVPGFQLAKSGGFDLFIWADDDTYLAENILTGTVGENGRATGRGFATALIRMAARKRLDKRALVLGAGPVGCAGAETLALAGYEVFLCDMDGEKARVACGALSGCTPCTPDDLSGLPLFECLLDAAPTNDFSPWIGLPPERAFRLPACLAYGLSGRRKAQASGTIPFSSARLSCFSPPHSEGPDRPFSVIAISREAD